MPDYVKILLWELNGWIIGVATAWKLGSNYSALGLFLLLVAFAEIVTACKRLVTKYGLSVGVIAGSSIVIFHGVWYIQVVCFVLLSLPILLEALTGGDYGKPSHG